ncbi:MAG: winged helix-turn-helix domain-containing protein [Acidimicrobiia bacterium]
MRDMKRPERISLAAARRIALAAQGFDRSRPTGRVDRRHVRRLFDDIGLLQVDSVNVLTRSEELPVFARLGAHDRRLVRSMEAAGELFEYWAHEASLLPVELEPFLRHRMEAAATDGKAWSGLVNLARTRPGFIADVRAEIAERGPLRAGALSGATTKTEKWWGWTDHKMALEYLFWTGQISARRSASNFERLYDLRERILPAEVLATPAPDARSAHKELLARSARHHGIGSARCLADYFRLNIPAARPLLEELAEEGIVNRTEVEGWNAPAYVHRDARWPRSVRARALLSPFDSLIWERTRTERLWDFHYRLEIYTPAPKRVHGYYVLPFLLDDAIVARVDLKADRKGSRLLVHGAYLEPDADENHVADELQEELTLLATWLELDTVEVADRGDLARPLQRALVTPLRG